MSALFHAGPEGQRFLINDELRYRGSEPLVMKDRTTVLPTDISWWKKKRRHFAKRLRQIEEKERVGKLPTTTMPGPAANEIYNWIPAPSQFVAEDQALSRSSNKPLPNCTASEPGKRKRDRYDIPENSIQSSKKPKCDGLSAPRLRPQRSHRAVDFDIREATTSETPSHHEFRRQGRSQRHETTLSIARMQRSAIEKNDDDGAPQEERASEILDRQTTE
ncbi:hypothetical protein F66182_8822 [Fusarium sp. NRRL 66182]|nr:hypothetical protein F66182_8822 [Fusarium sp. NRRL 66182]